MEEKAKKEYFTKILLFILFGLYWIFNILSWITSDGNVKFISIIIKIFMFMPFTIVIAFQKYRYSILFVLIYSIYIILMSFMSFIQGFPEDEKGVLIEQIGSGFSLTLGIFMLITSIRLMRNKENKFKYLLLILMCIVVTVTIIQLVVAKELLIKDIFNSISSMILLLMISIFYAFFPKIEIKIFNY